MNLWRLLQQVQQSVATRAGADLSNGGTWGDEVNVLDSLEAFLEMLLYGFGVPRLAQYLQQVVIGHKVEPREDHPVQSQQSLFVILVS